MPPPRTLSGPPGPAPTFTVALNGHTLAFALGGIIGLVVLFACSRKSPVSIPAEVVWKAIQEEAPREGLDALFVLNIAFAESSLNAHANTGYARGLMQLSHAAWTDRTDRPYEQAYSWRINLKVAMAHLAYLKGQLEEADRYSTARLAIAYHRGLGALVENGYAVSGLSKTPNKIYQRLFSNEIVPLHEFGL